ncbi:MAG: hypothetical protein U0T84_07075 [Chitinophagales bacterium]
MIPFSPIFKNFDFVTRAYQLMFVKQMEWTVMPIIKPSYELLQAAIEKNVIASGFQKVTADFRDEIVSKADFWNRRNLNLNRSIVLLEINQTLKVDELINHLQTIKLKLGKVTGYVPFFNEVGMQVVVYASNMVAGAIQLKPVDTINNQRALIQRVFIIDERNGQYRCAQTVMQTITGKIQQGIHQTIVDEMCH